MKQLASMLCAVPFTAVAWLGPTSLARSETFNCTTITTLPATIASPGHYCLNKNFSQDFATAAITINADDVVLDCNNRTITHSNPAGTSNGIQSESHSNVTIRNCNTSGFYVAIYLPEYTSGGSRNNRVLNNNITRSRYYSMVINGSGNLIEGNRITNMLGDYVGYGNAGIQLYSYDGLGNGNVIRGNVIADFKPALPGLYVYGIHFFGVTDTTIADNTISGLTARTNAATYGILGERTIGTAITGNSILAPVSKVAPYDGASYYGIHMWFDAPGGELKNLCTDNTVGNFNTDIAGCVEVDNTKF